jgi:pimeloyl-ACP methyl ester carboxylesterase
MRYLGIDDYLAHLNIMVDEIGIPVDLIGLCQGGWMVLVYAARFPGKVRKLVLAGLRLMSAPRLPRWHCWQTALRWKYSAN